MIYALRSFSCLDFKVLFFLWNESGLSLAKASVVAGHTPDFQWLPARSKRSMKSLVVASKKLNNAPLSRSNLVPLGCVFDRLKNSISRGKKSIFSRLTYREIVNPNLQTGSHPSLSAKNMANAKNTVIEECTDEPDFCPPLSPASVDLNLNLGLNLSTVSPGFTAPAPSTGSPHVLGRLGSQQCTRCLSYRHSRPMCNNRVRCTACFRLGHIALHFRDCLCWADCLPSRQWKQASSPPCTPGFA